MPTRVVMEALSPTMEEGRLVEWKKQPGDAVAAGDVLAEVETDKAVMELVARAGGTLLTHLVPVGTTVPVSQPVAWIGEAGEAVPGAAAAAPAPAATPTAAPGPRPQAPGAPAPGPQPPASPARRLKASPLALRLAAERGIDLDRVRGSGPDGRIVLRDIEAATPSGRTSEMPALRAEDVMVITGSHATPAVAAAPVTIPAPASDGFADVPLTQMRKAIARRLVQSLGPIPTFYLTAEADVERLWEARQALNAAGGAKVSVNDIVLKAVATALRQHPACNAWWMDDRIRQWADVHLGMAVATDDGLITPVIRHAHAKSLRAIAAESADLVARAKARKLGPDEYTGATCSVSNLGMLGIDEFTAIINPPEAAILAVGRVAEQPVVHEGAVVVRRRMRVTLSCDHRVIDGAVGARFLQSLVGMLENPLAMV
ncbi:MAG: dihydrolipoamide acetyltransferase family protein [Gemmatimonadales bacterium]|nr:dihydrolipoamide acetyltransferase family protein [Gemmatimonadales bacterium]